MKKKIAVLLTVLMVLGCMPAMASAGHITPRIPLSGTGTAVDYYIGKGGGGEAIKLETPLAQRFIVKGKLVKLYMNCPSYNNAIGSMTFRLYQWNGDYAKTIQGKVLAEQTFTNFADNALLSMGVPGTITGELLLVVCNPVEAVGVWTNTAKNPNSANEVLYIDGKEQPGRAMILSAEVGALITADKLNEAEAVDAYSKIDLSKPSDSSGMEFSKYGSEPYAKLDGVDSGYLRLVVDFGTTSPKGATIRLRNDVEDAAKIQIIADDLNEGPILCEFYAEVSEELSYWMEIPAKITENITGKHNIYVAVMYPGLALFDLTFLKETPGPSWDEQRLADFEATKDFELKSTYSDTWVATDLLGRKLPDHTTVGDHNPDKQVGIFYWTWHSGRGQNINYSVNQRVINSYNGPEEEIKNDFHYVGWSGSGIWNESVYGIYSGYDDWVMRKHMELLSAAGVDGLFFDATNGTNVWTGGYMELAATMHKMHLDGIQTPGMAFMLPFFNMSYNVTDLERIYESMYSIGLYSDTWYYWDGKPVVMGYPNNLLSEAGNDEIKAQHEEILDFFTFRPGQPDYRKGLYQENQWPWLEVYPQHPYGKSEKYGCETVSVGVAMNGNDNGLDAMNGKNIYGRSFTYKDRFTKLSSTSKYYGYNFSEQWERAYELNPEFVFITGWNEWTVGHYEVWGQDTTGAYPDQYSDEYSRDLEPTKGEFKDTYYYLLVNHVRKFKGVRPTPTASEEKTIDLSAGFDQWKDVGPEFIGYKGGTEPREAYLRQAKTPVTNYTGRNDIVLSKVARDADNLYFYVQTAQELSPYTDKSWMRLLINTDRKYKTGWEGYDYILNRVSPTENTATLEKWVGSETFDWDWETVAQVEYTLSGNEMMIKIPKTLMGITEDSIDIEFKWNDNMQMQGDIMDFYNNGDTAPIGRFNYRYVDEASVKNQVKDEPVDPVSTLPHLTSRFVVMALGSSDAYVYGNRTRIDAESEVTAPVIVNDKTMLPVRFLAESLGATVEWDDATQTVKIVGTKRIQLKLGSNQMRVEKNYVTLQSPAVEIENRIYVPLRDIVEALDIACYWFEPGLILCGTPHAYAEIATEDSINRLLKAYKLV